MPPSIFAIRRSPPPTISATAMGVRGRTTLASTSRAPHFTPWQRARHTLGSGRESLRPFFDILDALHYLHAHEILHLDIHAGNIIVGDKDRGSVLIDFGLGRLVRSGDSWQVLTPHSNVAPELLVGDAPGRATDIYAVGQLLLYFLTGRDGPSHSTHVNPADGSSPPAPTLPARPNLPRELPGFGQRATLELERIVGKALQRQPHRRFSNAREFRDALLHAVGDRQPPPTRMEPGSITVGRQEVVAAIADALKRANTPLASFLHFEGPDGIGKSRLLEEARHRAQLLGLTVVPVAFAGKPGGEPALRRALGTRGLRRDSRQWLGPLSVEHGGSSLERARRAVDAYFSSSGPPLVIVVDEFEQADEESRQLLEAFLIEGARRDASAPAGRGLALFLASSAGLAVGLPARFRRTITRRLRPLPLHDAKVLLTTLARPLQVPESVVSKLARRAKGNPYVLRQTARALHAGYGARGLVPLGAEIPPLHSPPVDAIDIHRLLDPSERWVLQALAVLGRPLSLEELEVVTERSRRSLSHLLRRCAAEEVVTVTTHARLRHFHLSHRETERVLHAEVPQSKRREMHRAVARHLREKPSTEPTDLERLARHLLGCSQRREARTTAFSAAGALRRAGLRQTAVQLLKDISQEEPSVSWRLRLAEETSSLLDELGDHQEGVEVLAPLLERHGKAMRPAQAVRFRRRLGGHYHRAGRAEKARSLFRAVRRRARLPRDVDELMFVESELAELHTFRGDYEEAERACARGLQLLENAPQRVAQAKCSDEKAEFRRRVEVMLKASLGHLELRRVRLDTARRELEAAAELAKPYGTTTLEAFIRNNLGVVFTQMDDLPRAWKHYRQAERLLDASGERRGVIHIACNLANIAAKQGRLGEAQDYLQRAEELLTRYPGARLEFAVALTRGSVALSAGDLTSASEAYREAIPLGGRLGDEQFVGFAQVYLADALLGSGLYGEAQRRLRSLLRSLERRPPQSAFPALERAVCGRLLLVEALLGRARPARRLLDELDAAKPLGIANLDGWTTVARAAAHLLLSDSATTLGGDQCLALARSAATVFKRVGVTLGRRLAELIVLAAAIRRGDASETRSALRAVESQSSSDNKLLAVFEPFLRAEASLALGELERAEDCLQEAASAMVGSPFLELDWQVERLHAIVAERHHDREGARRALHRALQGRDLLAQSLPKRLRSSFLAQARFVALEELAERLQRPRPTLSPSRLSTTPHTQLIARQPLPDQRTPKRRTPVPPRSQYQGMVGRSAVMLEVFETIERLRDHEITILIRGETGTGKELAARALHRAGPRRTGPFHALHCASLPEELFESELFGYEAGAFSGAEETRAGLLEHLSGGTLLFDEVTELAPATQGKLLRVIDGGVYRPLGSSRILQADVRFLASTRQDVDAAVADGAFREDLLHRFRGLELRLPPLRDRRGDTTLLAAHFASQWYGRLEQSPPRITDEALRTLEQQPWPGNVRELAACLTRAFVMASPGAEIDTEALDLTESPPHETLFREDQLAGKPLGELRDALERAYLTWLFRSTRGDTQAMMDTLGVQRATLYRWLRRVGVDAAALRRELRE